MIFLLHEVICSFFFVWDSVIIVILSLLKLLLGIHKFWVIASDVHGYINHYRNSSFPHMSSYFKLIIDQLDDSLICRLAEALCNYIEQDRPFLGICLGLQLLFESSEENGPGSYLTLLLIFHALALCFTYYTSFCRIVLSLCW